MTVRHAARAGTPCGALAYRVGALAHRVSASAPTRGFAVVLVFSMFWDSPKNICMGGDLNSFRLPGDPNFL